ncbi:hypothetical protein AN958_06223 [Leucoagaricus sp. SymC.cos]|nr:hypothetical protein AN958_06223 [Leucoagaricus sp. SymC.cos]
MGYYQKLFKGNTLNRFQNPLLLTVNLLDSLSWTLVLSLIGLIRYSARSVARLMLISFTLAFILDFGLALLLNRTGSRLERYLELWNSLVHVGLPCYAAQCAFMTVFLTSN